MATQANSSPLLKGFAISSTIWIASAMASTSLVFVPSLLRPLSASAPPTETPSVSMPSSRSASALQIPTLANDGRLTPQPDSGNNKGFDLRPVAVARSYKVVAQAFGQMDTLAFRAQVPLEFVTAAAYGLIAYRSRNAGSSMWTHWAASAGLVAALFPFTGALMHPLTHKLLRLGGDEEKIEPYEDSPPDRDAEKSNTVEFLTKWSALNFVRTLGVAAAAAVSMRAVLLE